MEICYQNLENEVVKMLDENLVWVLSTSLNDYVTSRPVSIVHRGLEVYFQTNKCYIKHEQMNSNKRVSLCCQNLSIEGIAEEIGDWNDEGNAQLLELYKSRHIDSFREYGSLKDQVVYKIIPIKVKLWKYVGGKPLREILFVNEQRAERLEFM